MWMCALLLAPVTVTLNTWAMQAVVWLHFWHLDLHVHTREKLFLQKTIRNGFPQDRTYSGSPVKSSQTNVLTSNVWIQQVPFVSQLIFPCLFLLKSPWFLHFPSSVLPLKILLCMTLEFHDSKQCHPSVHKEICSLDASYKLLPQLMGWGYSGTSLGRPRLGLGLCRATLPALFSLYSLLFMEMSF